MIPTRFILRRLVLQIGVLIGLTALTFLLMFKLPGDPTAALLAITGFTPNPRRLRGSKRAGDSTNRSMSSICSTWAIWRGATWENRS